MATWMSVIDELPPGRKPIRPFISLTTAGKACTKFMRKQIQEGRQGIHRVSVDTGERKDGHQNLEEGYMHVCEEFP